jgi:hypothetical protein
MIQEEEKKYEEIRGDDISNKSLALFLGVVIIISLLSLGITMTSLSKLTQPHVTGLATGYVNVTIGNITACNVDTNVSFGTGSATRTLILSVANDTGANASGFNNCSDSTPSPCYRGMQINNTGNSYIVVNFSSDKNASGLLGDSSPLTGFTYDIRNGTFKTTLAVGCIAVLGTSGSINLNTNYTVCGNLSYITGADTVSIGYNITINETTPKSSKQANIIISCSQA